MSRPLTPGLPLTSQPGGGETCVEPQFAHLPNENNCTDLLNSSAASRLGPGSVGWGCQVPRAQLRDLSRGRMRCWPGMSRETATIKLTSSLSCHRSSPRLSLALSPQSLITTSHVEL